VIDSAGMIIGGLRMRVLPRGDVTFTTQKNFRTFPLLDPKPIPNHLN